MPARRRPRWLCAAVCPNSAAPQPNNRTPTTSFQPKEQEEYNLLPAIAIVGNLYVLCHAARLPRLFISGLEAAFTLTCNLKQNTSLAAAPASASTHSDAYRCCYAHTTLPLLAALMLSRVLVTLSSQTEKCEVEASVQVEEL